MLNCPLQTWKLTKGYIGGKKLSAHIEYLCGSIQSLILNISYVHCTDIYMAIYFASATPLYTRSGEWLNVSELLVNLLICNWCFVNGYATYCELFSLKCLVTQAADSITSIYILYLNSMSGKKTFLFPSNCNTSLLYTSIFFCILLKKNK